MKKIGFICSIIGLALIFNGCLSNNGCPFKKDVKEIKIIHEHHIFIHKMNKDMNRRPIHKHRQNKKFDQSKSGIDPRYDHKAGSVKPETKN